MSDTHINSKTCDYKALSTSIRELNDSADVILHAGDLTDGTHVYRGHEHNVEDASLDDVVQRTGDILDQVKVPMHVILGNHDESYQKRMGVDLGNTLLGKLPNIEFHGFYMADIPIFGEVFRLLHPTGGAYTISYPA
jgi:predicted phosphodiesterase